jgi:hypothetical protein
MGELQKTRRVICYEPITNQQRKKRIGAFTSKKKNKKYTE